MRAETTLIVDIPEAPRGIDRRSFIEAGPVGSPIAEPEGPLELLRTIHANDPCLACAFHIVDVEGRKIPRVKVR